MTEANPSIDSHDETPRESSELEDNLKSRPTWLRFLFMVLFAFVFNLAALVGSVIVVVNFLFVLFTGEANDKLREAGQTVANYLYDIVRYLTYNTDTRPFPFEADLRSTSD